jgi:hypothetical protein
VHVSSIAHRPKSIFNSWIREHVCNRQIVSGIFDLSDGVKKVKLGSVVNGVMVMVVVVFKTVG